MKTKLPVIAIAAFLFSACSTGSYVTRTYDDDIYFSPTDVPPVARVENESPDNTRPAGKDKSDARKQQVVLSQVQKNADGTKTLNNDIFESDDRNQNYQAYNLDNQDLAESDTTIYYDDDSVKYVINNYYDNNDDIGFAYRIGRFHNPYYLSPFFYDDWNYGFYSPWYSGYYGMNYGWGWDPYFSMGWGYPYSYYGYYSPFAYGFGGYWGGYGGYFDGYYHGYYNGYYGSGGGFYNDHHRDNIRYGRSTDFSNYTVRGGGSTNRESGSAINRSVMSQKSGQLIQNGENARSTRLSRTVSGNGNIDSRTQIGRQSSSTSGNVRRSYEPSTTGRTYKQGQAVRQSQNYTPSYNKPRIVNQSNYNNNSYTRPLTSQTRTSNSTLKSSGSVNSGSTYSQPRSSSSMRQTYRSSSTYSSGSSSSPSRSSSSYSSPSYNNSGSSPSYSAPSRSSSSGSSYSGGSSGGSSGSSGGSSGGRSGNGGRR